MSESFVPHNIDAETQVLGAVFLDGDVMTEVGTILSPEDFFRETHGTIFSVLQHCHDNALPLDSVSVADRLAARGELEQVGGVGALADIQIATPHAANAVYHAQIVRQHSVRRRLIGVADTIYRVIRANDLTAEEQGDLAGAALGSALDALVSEKETALGAAVNTAWMAIQDRTDGQVMGVPTGLRDLDESLDGLKAPKLYILAARPSIGKSALAFQIAWDASIRYGTRVRFVSLEMSEDELAERYLSSASGVPASKFKVLASVSPDEHRRLAGAIEDSWEKAHVVIDDEPNQSIFQIVARARRHKARKGLDLLVVDYLQLIDGQQRRGESREQEVSRISRRLKGLAKELGIPVIACCQLNRKSEEREDKRPRVADLRESGSIEQDADVVILLHRPDHYDPNDNPGLAEVNIGKHRGGPTGVLKLKFLRWQTRFEDWNELPAGVMDGPAF